MKPSNYVIGYMCRIAQECELGMDSSGTKIYPSLEELKKYHDCWEDCGVVEVFVLLKEVIVSGKY